MKQWPGNVPQQKGPRKSTVSSPKIGIQLPERKLKECFRHCQPSGEAK